MWAVHEHTNKAVNKKAGPLLVISYLRLGDTEFIKTIKNRKPWKPWIMFSRLTAIITIITAQFTEIKW